MRSPSATTASHTSTPPNRHNRLTSAPYLVWTPLPYDIPDGGTAFACLGAGDQGCLFIDLGAAPGPVAIGGDHHAAARLAESIMHQLCTAEAAGPACTVVVVGDALAEPLPSAAAWAPSLRDLSAPPPPPGGGTEVVFCQVRSGEDASALERYVSSARRRVIPVVLANLPGAPWSFTAQPSRHPNQALHSIIA